MQRNSGRGAPQLLNDSAIIQLLKHVAWLAQAWKARKTRASRADAPRRNRDAKALNLVCDCLNLDASAGQAFAQTLEITLKMGA